MIEKLKSVKGNRKVVLTVNRQVARQEIQRNIDAMIKIIGIEMCTLIAK